jgi:hypothetical protein
MGVQRGFTRYLFNHLDPTIDQGSDLTGIVGKKANPTDAEITQNGDRQAKIPAISREAQRVICFHRVETRVLQSVGFEL